MAEKKDLTKDVASEDVPAEVTVPEDAPAASTENKFPLNVLRENCFELFKVTSSTFAGATSQQEDGEYSVSEMKDIIKEWLSKGVK